MCSTWLVISVWVWNFVRSVFLFERWLCVFKIRDTSFVFTLRCDQRQPIGIQVVYTQFYGRFTASKCKAKKKIKMSSPNLCLNLFLRVFTREVLDLIVGTSSRLKKPSMNHRLCVLYNVVEFTRPCERKSSGPEVQFNGLPCRSHISGELWHGSQVYHHDLET